MRPRWSALAAVLYALLTVAGLAGWPRALDTAAADALRTFGVAHPTLIDTVKILTDVAATEPVLAVGLTLGAILRVRGKRRAAYLTLATTALVPALWSLSHLLMPHTRPPDAFIQLTSNGFPSGHTANAAAAGVLAVLLLAPARRAAGRDDVLPLSVRGTAPRDGLPASRRRVRLASRRRVLVWVVAVAFAVSIGLTRLLLLAHYPSQVLGGFLLAAAVVPALADLIDRVAVRSRV